MSDDKEKMTEKEKMIENVSVSPEAPPKAAEDELSEADLETLAGASGHIMCVEGAR